MDVITIDEAIKIVPGGVDAATTVIWIVHIVAVIATFIAGFKSAEYYAEDDGKRGFIAFVGMFLCGAAPSIAALFTFN